MRSYLSKYQGTKPWTTSEIFDGARACWKKTRGRVLLVRLDDLPSDYEKEFLRQIGVRLYGEI